MPEIVLHGPNSLRDVAVIFFLCCKEYNNTPLLASDKEEPSLVSLHCPFGDVTLELAAFAQTQVIHSTLHGK